MEVECWTARHQSVRVWPLERKVVKFQGEETQVARAWTMQPGDLAPNFTGLACLAGQIEDFDSTDLNGLYSVLVFYEVLGPTLS